MPDYQPLHRCEHFNILHQFLRTTLMLTHHLDAYANSGKH